jgi:hypothetical protein
MDAVAPLVADVEPSESMEPGKGPLDHPTRPAQAAAMGRAPAGELGANAARLQVVAMRLRIVGPVALHQRRLTERRAAAAAERGNALDQRNQLGDIVAVGGGDDGRQGNAPRFGEKVVLRPFLTAIGWVRSSFFPPRTARTDELSTIARARSSWPRWRSSASNAAWRRFQTPARCQRTRRRQQVLPEPQPISNGSICQGMPVRRTKRIPVNAARSETRGRPIVLNRLRGGFGSNGSMRLHRGLSISGLAIRDRLAVGHATVPSRDRKYKG